MLLYLNDLYEREAAQLLKRQWHNDEEAKPLWKVYFLENLIKGHSTHHHHHLIIHKQDECGLENQGLPVGDGVISGLTAISKYP